MATNFIYCPNCSAQNLAIDATCKECGLALPRLAVIPDAPSAALVPVGAEKKVAAGVCGILLGSLGVHKFILGYPAQGTIMLAISLVGFLLCGGVPTLVVGIIGLIEGIMYLTKPDQEFVNTYITNKKGWL